MTLSDLVLIVVVLATLVSLGAAALAALRRRWEDVFRRLRRLALGIAGYMGVVTLVSLLGDRRVVALGEDQCSDDWCVAVVAATASPTESDSRLDVVFRLSSHALRVTQRERFVVAYVVDSEGTRYDATPTPDEVPFDTLLGPGTSVSATRHFRVPIAAHDLGIVVAREGDFAFPRCCIIGQGLFYQYPIVHVETVVGSS